MKAQELEKLLMSIGFIEKRQNGSHTIMRNPNFGSIVTLPSQGEVSKPILISIKKNIVEKGIISEREFDRIINGNRKYQVI